MRAGRVRQSVRVSGDRMSSRRVSSRPYRVVIYGYGNSRTTNLENKIVAGSRASKLLLHRAGQLEINSVLFYQGSHAGVRHGGFKTVFDVGGRNGPGSLWFQGEPARGTPHHNSQYVPP